MITFLGCLGLLVAAYFTYGRYLERLCGVVLRGLCLRPRRSTGGLYPDADVEDFSHTAAQYRGAGADFRCRAGAAYGPVAFLWITFGGIFMGAAHDFIAGIVSLRSNGASLPETVGTYLGRG